LYSKYTYYHSYYTPKEEEEKKKVGDGTYGDTGHEHARPSSNGGLGLGLSGEPLSSSVAVAEPETTPEENPPV
jgi:hypothetical protein